MTLFAIFHRKKNYNRVVWSRKPYSFCFFPWNGGGRAQKQLDKRVWEGNAGHLDALSPLVTFRRRFLCYVPRRLHPAHLRV